MRTSNIERRTSNAEVRTLAKPQPGRRRTGVRWDALTLFLFRYDDEGLIGAISAAQTRIEALRPSVNAQAAAATTLPAPAAQPAASESKPKTIDQLIDAEFGLKAIAEA